jgi:hypothetical protein
MTLASRSSFDTLPGGMNWGTAMTSNLVRGGVLAAVSVLAIGFGTALLSADTLPAPGMQDIVSKGAWAAGATYAKDDIVILRGSTWRSKVANNKGKVPGSTNPNNSAFWEAFAVGFNPAGAWVGTKTYQPNELVTLNGQTWRAKITNVNASPAANANWELFAAKGAAGSNGATGPAGPNTGIGAGTTSVPSISFNGDANTGIYSPSADKIAMVEGGTLLLHNIGSENTALGFGALPSGSTGVGNTAVGHLALSQNTTGIRNAAFGAAALFAATTASGNSAFGLGALENTTSGSFNIAVGSFTSSENTNGNSNTAVGTEALSLNTTGSKNVAVGFESLYTVIGRNNTALGAEALRNANTGSNNIAIGYHAGIQAPIGVTNSIYIGNDGTSTGSNTIIIGNGSTTTAFMAGISGATSSSGVAVFVNSSGQLGTATSSRRFKQDIEPVTGGSALLDRLQPVSFRYKQADTDGSKPLQYGLIAEDVEALSRDLVVYDKDGKINTVKYHFLPPLLLAGYQAQQKTITAQTNKIDALEAGLRGSRRQCPG